MWTIRYGGHILVVKLVFVVENAVIKNIKYYTFLQLLLHIFVPTLFFPLY